MKRKHSCKKLKTIFFIFFVTMGGFKGETISYAAAEVSPSSSIANQMTSQGVIDFSVLPLIKGEIDQYLPSPYGDLRGVLLTDGTQVVFSSEFGDAVKKAVQPGQKITLRGLKGRKLPLVIAFSLSNQMGYKIFEDIFQADYSPVSITGPDVSVHSAVKAILYNSRGQIMGIVLKDKTVVYLSSSSIEKVKPLIKHGFSLWIQGPGNDSALGKAIQARRIGFTLDKMMELPMPVTALRGAPAGSANYDAIP